MIIMFGLILMAVLLVFKACPIVGKGLSAGVDPVFFCSGDDLLIVGQTTASSCEYTADSGTVNIYVRLQQDSTSGTFDQAKFTTKRTDGLTTTRYELFPEKQDVERVYQIPITLVDERNDKVFEICAEYYEGMFDEIAPCTECCLPITINDPVAVTPEVSFEECTYVINEGGQLTVTVNILNAGDPVNVEFEVRPLTASSTDYSLDTTSPVTASSAMIPITLSAMMDSDLEGVEVFEISLIPSTSAPAAKYTIGAITKAIVFIREVPTVTLEECTYAVTEGASVAVNIVNGGDKPVDVVIATRALTADSTDYSLDRTTVSVPAKSMSPVTVSAVDDGTVEGGEQLEISIVAMPATYSVGTPSKATVYIKDPAPAASEYCLGNTLYTIMESNGPVEITIYRTGDLRQAGSVVLSSTNVDAITPSDYAGTSMQVMFGPGLPSQTVDIGIMNDDQIEASECFQVALSQPNGGEMCALTSATVIIKDDDCCFSFENRHYTALESSAPLDVCVVKTGYLGGDSLVSVQTTSGSAQQNDDFTAVSTNLQFGSGAAIMCVPGLMINEDGEYERPEQFTVAISTNDPSRICEPSTATVTIKSSDLLCEDQCENGGICIEYLNACWCPPGFEGDRCEMSSCVLPCQNGGICFGNGACFCPSGFTGPQCEISVPPLADVSTFSIPGQISVMSVNGVTAVFDPLLNVVNSAERESFLALIRPLIIQALQGLGFVGLTIDGFSTGSINVQYNAIFLSTSTTDSEDVDTRIQTLQTTAPLSGIVINPDPLATFTLPKITDPGSCPADYCLNSGTCITRGSSYSCHCTEGYKGAKCEEQIADQSGGIIAGIVISSVVGLAIVSFMLLALFRFLVRRAAKPNGRSTEFPMNNGLGNGGAVFTDGTVVRYPYQPDTLF